MKTIYHYTYKGHQILVVDITPRNGHPQYRVAVAGPVKCYSSDTYTTEYLIQAIERDLDSAIARAGGKESA